MIGFEREERGDTTDARQGCNPFVIDDEGLSFHRI